VSIEVLQESGAEVDVRRLADLSRFVLDRLRVHPQAELCIKVVDPDTMAEINEHWMGHEGPTDVLSFPMDELRPGMVGEDPVEGVLGDMALCPQVAERQATEARERGQRGYTTTDELDLLTVHGILHLLGYDHAQPEEHAEMFGLQARLLAEWEAVRSGADVEAGEG
jgi:probable rRNA maturation factor